MKSNGGRLGCGGLIALLIGGTFAIAFITNLWQAGSTSFQEARSTAQQRAIPKVNVTFTSDPEDATIYVDGQRMGTTPATVQVPKDQRVHYRLVASEPYSDYNLYEPFTSAVTLTDDDAINVWIPRTTAEEQAAQRERAEQARREQEAARKAEEERRQREIDALYLYYRIDTNCRYGADLTYSNANGDTTQQGNRGSGWWYRFVPRSGQFLYLSAQNQCDYGYITVKFVKDGVTVRENTSSGAYVIAQISGRW